MSQWQLNRPLRGERIVTPQPVRARLTSVIALALVAAFHIWEKEPGEFGGNVTEERGEQLTQADGKNQTNHAARIRHLAVCNVSVARAHTLGSTSERYEDGGRTHGWMLPATSFHSYEGGGGGAITMSWREGGGATDVLAVSRRWKNSGLDRQNVNHP